MTAIVETHDPPAPSPATSNVWKRTAILATLAAVVAVAALAFALTRDDGRSGTTDQALVSQRIAATQSACQQWLGSSGSTPGTPNTGWCGAMGAWMSGQMTNGHMTSGAWASPQSMVDACRQWSTTATSTPSGADPTAWCQQMVTWMTQRMGGWNNSDDWDNHMGGWGGGMMGR